LKQLDMKELVRLWIDSGVQPVLFAVELNHRFVYRNLIRSRVVVGL